MVYDEILNPLTTEDVPEEDSNEETEETPEEKTGDEDKGVGEDEEV